MFSLFDLLLCIVVSSLVSIVMTSLFHYVRRSKEVDKVRSDGIPSPTVSFCKVGDKELAKKKQGKSIDESISRISRKTLLERLEVLKELCAKKNHLKPEDVDYFVEGLTTIGISLSPRTVTISFRRSWMYRISALVIELREYELGILNRNRICFDTAIELYNEIVKHLVPENYEFSEFEYLLLDAYECHYNEDQWLKLLEQIRSYLGDEVVKANADLRYLKESIRLTRINRDIAGAEKDAKVRENIEAIFKKNPNLKLG